MTLSSYLKRTPTMVDIIIVALVVIGVAVAGMRLKRIWERRNLEAGLQRTILHVQTDLRTRREFLVSAIQNYKGSLGYYPPDHVISQAPLTVDPVTNQLLYELMGTVYDPTNGSFSPGEFPPINTRLAKRFFNVDGFKNSADRPESVRRFLNITNAGTIVGINERPDDVGLLGYWPNWDGIDPDLYRFISLASWRYNSSSPKHNPGAFDLWIEIKTPRTNIMVGNW
jgi:hypothetical protein